MLLQFNIGMALGMFLSGMIAGKYMLKLKGWHILGYGVLNAVAFGVGAGLYHLFIRT
jgi:hypothetical protein